MTIEERLEVELKIITSNEYFNDFFKIQHIDEFLKEKKLNLLSVFEEFLNEKYPHLKEKHILAQMRFDHRAYNALKLLRPFVIEYNSNRDFTTFLASFDKFITENKTDICEVIYVHGIDIEQLYQKIERLEFIKLFNIEFETSSNEDKSITQYSYNPKGYFPNRITSRFYRFNKRNPLDKLNRDELPSFAMRISAGESLTIFNDEPKSFTLGAVFLRWQNELILIDKFQILNLITDNCVVSMGHYDDLYEKFCPILEGSSGTSLIHSKYNNRLNSHNQEKLDLKKFENTLNLYAKFKSGHEKAKDKKLWDMVSLAMRRFFLAKLEENAEDKLINFCICLEALLTNEGNSQEISLKFALNGAWLLADMRDKEDTHKFLKSIYELRSKIVHGNKPKKLHEIDLKKLQTITAEVILKYLELNEKPNFDKLRLGLV